MFVKIFILICLFVYIVLAIWNIASNDSKLLIEKFFIFLKNLLYSFLYG